MQTDLNRKRELLEQVVDRMKDLEDMGAEDDYASSDGEDILGEIIATPSESMDSRSTDILPPTEGTDDDQEQNAQPDSENENIVQTLEEVLSEKPDTVTSQQLRPRGGKQPTSDPEKEVDTAQATSSLFGNRTATSDVANTEAVLDNDRVEHEELLENILKTAGDLKLSSLRFGEALEEDTEVLTKAGEGLNKNEQMLEAAAKRMGALTRMTEGKGWWGRIMLYAWIYGLMVVLVLLVFALPKLRF